jgi:hypothetical protein
MVGTKRDLEGQYDMTLTEVVDITAAAATQSMVAVRNPANRPLPAAFGDALASEDQMMMNEALSRACPDVPQQSAQRACTEMALNEANEVALAFEEDVLQRIEGLTGLLRLLQTAPGRKEVLLLSGGLPVSDRGAGRPNLGREIQNLGEQATYANATIHTMYFDQQTHQAFSAESRRPRIPGGRARTIYTRALSEFAGPSGGMFFEVVTGAGEVEVDQLVRQASSYYVLGVQPDERDRDGRPHQVKVRVARRDTNIRSRQFVVVPRANN